MQTGVRLPARAFVLLCTLSVAGCHGDGDSGPPPDGTPAGLTAAPAGRRPVAASPDRVLRYRLAEIDVRFGITRERFLRVADEAGALWERAAGRELFRFDSTARFGIHLVFDERQARSNEAKSFKSRIDGRGRSYDHLVWQHERKAERLRESESRFDAAKLSFERRLDAYNATVSSWNQRGGAPQGEFASLETEKETLERERAALDRMHEDLAAEVEDVNGLVRQINEIASANDLDVLYYNGKFVESREFEQGQYTGNDITIYQFSGEEDLRLALAHEFGHALGFGHVEDPAAIMHYKMGRQPRERPALAAADRALLLSLSGR